MPSAPGSSIRRVVDAAMAHGLDVRTVPSMNDLLDGTLDAYRVRRVQVEDLLRRPSATEHADGRPRTGPRPDGRHHRRRRLDRLRARAPGLLARPAPPRPGGSRRERALSRPARARGAPRATARARASCGPTSRTSRAARSMDRLIAARAARRHLPRRRLQARADDGGAPVRRGPREHRRHAWRCSTRPRRPASSGSSSSRPTRPSGRRA